MLLWHNTYTHSVEHICILLNCSHPQHPPLPVASVGGLSRQVPRSDFIEEGH